MDKNEVSLTSGGELRISFDKGTNDITITTQGGNKMVFNDENNEIVIKDINSNIVKMSPDGISIDSSKSIFINSNEKVSIKGDMGVSIESPSGDIDSKGMNIKQNADVLYSAKGSASAEVLGGATLTLKAAMVMIN